MSTTAVVGIYDSYAEAETAEFRLEEAHLPVGQMSVIAPRMEDGKVEGDISARGVANTIASTGVRPSREQIAGYEQALRTGKHLLIFQGDAEQVAEAYRALGNTAHDELALLNG